MSAKELYFFLFNQKFENSLSRPKQFYNLKTKYDVVFGGANGYINSKHSMFEQIRRFIEEQSK